MNRLIESESEAIEIAATSSDPWRASVALRSHRSLGIVTLNARAVEFIAKPGKVRELRDCLRHEVVDYLGRRTGFAGAVVLTSHKEPRLILVLSFWRTEKEASDDHWESAPTVRRLVSSLVDLCGKVHTYEAALPNRQKTPLEFPDTAVC